MVPFEGREQAIKVHLIVMEMGGYPQEGAAPGNDDPPLMKPPLQRGVEHFVAGGKRDDAGTLPWPGRSSQQERRRKRKPVPTGPSAHL